MLLLIKLSLMGALLFGGLKTYANIPLLNENPMLSGTGSGVVVLMLLFAFPKLIGLFLKFALFSVVVLGLCHAAGLSFDDIVQKLSEANIQQRIEAMQISEPQGDMLIGRAGDVLSGNTFAYNGEIVRLYGIDVPDGGQTCKTQQKMSYACADQAAVELNAILHGKDVKCSLGAKDASGLRMATCYVDGDDIAALMVHDGWAIADKRQTNKYVEEEKSAYLKKTGIWNGYFEEPAKWRAKRAAAEKKAKEADDQIKKQAEEKNSSNSSASSGISPIRGIKKLFGLDK